MKKTPISVPTYDGVPPENISIENVKGQVPKAPRDLTVEVFSIEGAGKQAEWVPLGELGSAVVVHRAPASGTHVESRSYVYQQHAALCFTREMWNCCLLAGVQSWSPLSVPRPITLNEQPAVLVESSGQWEGSPLCVSGLAPTPQDLDNAWNVRGSGWQASLHARQTQHASFRLCSSVPRSQGEIHTHHQGEDPCPPADPPHGPCT